MKSSERMPNCRQAGGAGRADVVVLSVLVALAGVLAAAPSHAVDAVKPRGAGAATQKAAPAPKGKPADPLMTRAELRECLARKDRNQVEADQLLAEQQQITSDKTALLADGEALKAQLPGVDRTSAEAVADYNAKAKARDAAVDALSTRTDAFNGRVEAAQSSRKAWADTCGSRRYDERDEAAIRSGK